MFFSNGADQHLNYEYVHQEHQNYFTISLDVFSLHFSHIGTNPNKNTNLRFRQDRSNAMLNSENSRCSSTMVMTMRAALPRKWTRICPRGPQRRSLKRRSS